MPLGSWDPRELGRYIALAQVGFEMVAPVGIGLALDHYLNWSPWGIIGGAIFGLVAGMAHLIALVQRSSDEGTKPPRDQP